ncbi:MAG: AEC family transporter [Eubacteriales bacterium]|nr:AEC family transporter [Eubacteriales bacterium]
MVAMLELQFIIFALIGIGFLTRRKGMVSGEGQKNLTDIVINIVLPCNIVTSFIQEFPEDAIQECIQIFLISVGIQFFCLLYGKVAYPKETVERQKCLSYGIICSNAGFLGNPVAAGVYGPIGLALASVYLIPVRVMMWSEGVAVFSGQSDRKGAMKKIVTHPCVIACFLGIILMLTGTSMIPVTLLTLLQTIGRCNTALSMMVIGMILSAIDPHNLIDATVARYTVERLLLIPGVIWIVMRFLTRAGLATGIVPGLSVLLAAMPAGATTSMLAAKYDCDPEFGTRMVILSTLCSIPTRFLWSMLMT